MAHLAHYKEAHPLPFVITHWINAICMFCLIISGLFIHYPAIPSIMGLCRGLHMVCAFVILINLFARVIMAFFIKSAQYGGTREGLDRDIKNYLPSKGNKHQFLPWIKYYLFLKKDHPKGTKYGSPQKLSYAGIPFLLLFMGFTGFALWGPTCDWGIFVWFTNLVGGIMNVRIIHFFMMWVFIIFTGLHMYLALIEGPAQVAIMFKHKEHGGMIMDPETKEIIGEDLDPNDPDAKRYFN